MQTRPNIARLDSNRGIENLEIHFRNCRLISEVSVIDCDVALVDSDWSNGDPVPVQSRLNGIAFSRVRLKLLTEDIEAYVGLPFPLFAEAQFEATIDLAVAPDMFQFRFGKRSDTISGIGKSTLTLSYSQGTYAGKIVLVTDPTVLKVFAEGLRNAITAVTGG